MDIVHFTHFVPRNSAGWISPALYYGVDWCDLRRAKYDSMKYIYSILSQRAEREQIVDRRDNT